MKSLPKITDDTRITLYHKYCSCHQDFTLLHRFVIHNRAMRRYIAKRIEINPEWKAEADSMDVELPAIMFESDKGKTVITYTEFEKLYKKANSPKAKGKVHASTKEKVDEVEQDSKDQKD